MPDGGRGPSAASTQRERRTARYLRDTRLSWRERAMIRSIAYAVLATGLATSAVLAADPGSTASAAAAAAPTTEAFLKQAAAGNRFEIDSSKLALSKSSSTDVKALAIQLVTDHGEAAIHARKP